MNKQATAERVRAFNRFYTEAIGSLSDRHEGLHVTLAESRVLFTVSSFESPTVNQIADALDLDLAYTSRVLGSLEDARLIRRTISTRDRRQRVVAMSAKGRRLLDEIEQRSNQRAIALVGHLTNKNLDALLDAMDTIRTLITEQDSDDQPD